jgi:3-oxoacyl-[acyl-carrier protein] reductase
MLLEDRVALITGASRGIGRAVATTFAEHGATVVITSRSPELEETAAMIRARGGRATTLAGDLRDEAFPRELIKRCKTEHGRIDVLVNNAGVLQSGLLGMIPTQGLRETFETNVLAPINLTQYAIRLMDGERHPSIVNVASIAGTRGLDGVTGYSASKGAVVAFTLSSAKELAPRGIRVNAIAPGIIDTAMTQGLAEDVLRRRVAAIPMSRMGTAQEVANVALFLASSLASYVTGQVLGVDGGMVA